jgi:hypothetical protein
VQHQNIVGGHATQDVTHQSTAHKFFSGGGEKRVDSVSCNSVNGYNVETVVMPVFAMKRTRNRERVAKSSRITEVGFNRSMGSVVSGTR